VQTTAEQPANGTVKPTNKSIDEQIAAVKARTADLQR